MTGADTTWFDECRYGMFVHANIATVPAFAPVHEYADWYWAFLETKPDMVLHPTCPLPEVLAWHREHARDQPFDDFIPQLTFERFDADEYAQLLDDAGMRYLVHVTKHHDGFCWWDTKFSDRSSTHLGPKRDVTAELADAVRRRGHVFGCYYSLLDWSHADYPDAERYVDAYMRPQIQELVERFEPALLWGDGHWGHPGGHWRSDQVLADARSVAAERGFELVVNDRWFAASHDYAVYEYDVPEVPPAGRWELCRGLGYSFCVNRNERVEDHLSAAQVVALLVETVAKGGNLLLNVGPNADGTVPDIQAQVLRDSGEWVRANAEAIHGSTRFAVPGEGQHWYTRVGDRVHAFDLASASEPQFNGLGAVARVLASDGSALPFGVDSGVLSVDARAVTRHALGTRYVVELATQDGVTVSESRPGGAARAGKRYATITDALVGAVAGDAIDVGPGRYTTAIGEKFPLVVPAGVTVRAGGSLATRRVVIDAGGSAGVHLAGDGAVLERITVTGAAPGYMMVPPTCVISSGASNLGVRECHVESITLTGGTGHEVIANVVAGGAITLVGTNACEVRANYQHGLRWGVGIMIIGGVDHVVSENECRDDLCAIRLSNTDGARVDHNRAETRWWGIHVLDARSTAVVSNRAWHTMRAVDVEGAAASGTVVERQLAEHCDTGVMIERGATGTSVADSWFHDCRVGLLAWEAGSLEITNTAISAPRDHAVVSDQVIDLDLDLWGNQLDGDVWDRDMTEHLMAAIWRAAAVSPESVATAIVEQWAPEALARDTVEACAVSFAEPDQGPYSHRPDAQGLVPNCDALIALGLKRAHDLDDVPERDALHAIARRVEVWRVDPRHPLEWQRDWADGEYAPGIKMVSFMARAEALTHEQFSQHWTENHTPLALRHHVGLWNYTQNVVRRAFTPGGNAIDGIAELHFRTQDDFVYRFFDSDDGRAAIIADVAKFMARPLPETALMRELPLKTKSEPA